MQDKRKMQRSNSPSDFNIEGEQQRLKIEEVNPDMSINDRTKEIIDQHQDDPEPVERNKISNFIITLIIASNSYYFGYLMPIFNTLGEPLLQDVYHLKGEAYSMVLGDINFYFSVGAMIGVLGSGVLVDLVGRKKMLYLTEIFGGLFFLGFLIQNLAILRFFRFATGVIAGLISTIPQIYMTETLPRHLSSRGGVIAEVFGVFFILETYFQEWVFGKTFMVKHWRFFLTWPIAISIIRLLLLSIFVRYESPVYILRQNHKNLRIAEEKIQFIHSQFLREECATAEAKRMIQLYEIDKERKCDEDNFKVVLSDKYRLRFAAGLVLNIGQQLTGINFLILYSTELFDKISGNGENMSVVLGFANFVGALLGTKMITYFGRKSSILGGITLQTISFGLLVFSVKAGILWPIPIYVCVYICSFSFGMGGVIGPYAAELVPPVGLSICVFARFLFTALVAKMIPIGVET